METKEKNPITDPELMNLIGRRLIIANFEFWCIAVADPVYGRVEPAIGDYIKYIRAYLFFYSKGSPKNRRSKYSAFGFGSRLLHVLKRLFTRSLKPVQFFAESSTDQKHVEKPRGTNNLNT